MDRFSMMGTMKASIFNVLETMFFQPVQISDGNYTLDEWFSQDKTLIGATLNFSGPSAGSFYLLIPLKTAHEMTADFLGLHEEEINEEQKRDAIKEALNMIGGSMLSLMDKEGAYTLGIPALIEENDLTDNMLADLKGDILFIKTGDDHLAAGIMLEI
ncbi:MAG: chemotaxis protein CheX [Thermodesulfobacteriota bacterium]|nr:chemotaxis protein CheX [Thermodesulfobacteriota bacterium]